jgi:hypothetical protein
MFIIPWYTGSGGMGFGGGGGGGGGGATTEFREGSKSIFSAMLK